MVSQSKNVKGQKVAGKGRPRPEHDYYTTPISDVANFLVHHNQEMLSSLRRGDMNRPIRVLDPCAGKGNFRQAINQVMPAWEVTEWDIVQRESPLNFVGDFLAQPPQSFDIVMMNPPYFAAAEFIEHALQFVGQHGIVVAFLKLDFLATKKRHEQIFSKGVLTHVVVNVGRVHCKYNGDEDDTQSSTTESAWFVFRNIDEYYNPAPKISWLEKRNGK